MKLCIRQIYHSRKLRSFTLTDILVASLLSAILLAFVVTVFSFFMNRVRSENNSMDQMEDIFLLESSLNEVMRKCDSILVENNQIMFFTSGEKDSYTEFADSMIVVCLKETCDTFRLSHGDMHSTYLTETGLISRIDFKIDLGTFTVPVSLYKEYEGAVLVNSKVLAQ